MSSLNVRPTTTQEIIKTLSYLNECGSFQDESVNEFLENVSEFLKSHDVDEKNEYQIKEALGRLDAKVKEGGDLSPAEQKTSGLIHSIIGPKKASTTDELSSTVQNHCTWIGAHLFAENFVDTIRHLGEVSPEVQDRLCETFRESFIEGEEIHIADAVSYTKPIGIALEGSEIRNNPFPHWSVKLDYIPDESTDDSYVFSIEDKTSGEPRSEIKFKYNKKDQTFTEIKRVIYKVPVGLPPFDLYRQEGIFKVNVAERGSEAKDAVIKQIEMIKKKVDGLEEAPDGSKTKVSPDFKKEVHNLCDKYIGKLNNLDPLTVEDVEDIVENLENEYGSVEDKYFEKHGFSEIDEIFDDIFDVTIEHSWRKPEIIEPPPTK